MVGNGFGSMNIHVERGSNGYWLHVSENIISGLVHTIGHVNKDTTLQFYEFPSKNKS